jgi:hypothetical protein
VSAKYSLHHGFGERIVPTSNGIIKGLLGEMARLIRRVQDLIVENGEVESETKADWVGWSKVSLGDFGSVLVGLERLVGRLLSLVADGKLSKITVVVSLPRPLLVIGSLNE